MNYDARNHELKIDQLYCLLAIYFAWMAVYCRLLICTTRNTPQYISQQFCSLYFKLIFIIIL